MMTLRVPRVEELLPPTSERERVVVATRGEAGEDGAVYICLKQEDGSYAWVDLGAGGGGGGGGAVDSVNGATGVVVLDADDLSDTTTVNKFATAAELAKLAGIESGADVTDAANIAAAINTATNISPTILDRFAVTNEGAELAYVTWSSIVSYLGGNFQTLDAFLTDIANLTDPGADRILFWDDSAGDIVWLSLGTNLSITGTTLDATGGGGTTDHTLLTNIGTNSHAAIDSHLAATAAHGATGAVVGTTNTQTLGNKTLDNTTKENVDVGTVSDGMNVIYADPAAANVLRKGNVAFLKSHILATVPELIRDTMGTALVAGTNVTVTPNDAGDTITIAATPGGGGGATWGGITGTLSSQTDLQAALDAKVASATLPETIQDTVDTMLVDTGTYQWTYDDAAGTLALGHTLAEALNRTAISNHLTSTSNPHSVTKAQVGLGSVPNTDATARASHTGTQSADTIVDGTTNHVFTAADDTKLGGIATGATANSSDATLLARANHTGTQLASTISDLAATITAHADVAANTAARHSHSNKALLDTYAQTEVNLADAVTKKHAHANSAVLAATTASFLTADETKLDGIATGATANSSDATLLARANHTGTQPASTVSDFDEAVRDAMGTALVAGANVTITPNDVGDQITIAATPGGGGGATNLAATLAATQTVITSDTGTDATIPAADATNAGVMTAAMQTKLGGIATNATADAPAGDGAATTFSRSDHQHKGAGTLSVALGTPVSTLGPGSVTIGPSGKGDGIAAIAIGNTAEAHNQNTVAIGSLSDALGLNAVSLGPVTSAASDHSIVLGSGASVGASSPRSGAFGYQAAVPASTPDRGILRFNEVELARSNGSGETTLRLASADGTIGALTATDTDGLRVNGNRLSVNDLSGRLKVRVDPTATSTLATGVAIPGFTVTLTAGQYAIIDINLLIGCSGVGGVKVAILATGAYALSAQQFGNTTSQVLFATNRTDTSGVLGTAYGTVAAQTSFIRITGTIGTTSTSVFTVQYAAGTAGQTASVRVGSSMSVELI